MGRPKRGVTFWDRVRAQTNFNTPKGCFEFCGNCNTSGYGHIHRDGKLVLIHREAWAEVNGTIPDGKQVLHSCDNPPCWNQEHLFLGTHAINMADKASKGRVVVYKGERNHRSKLTAAIAQQIREDSELTLKQAAAKYGVGKSLVSYVRRGERWA